MAIEKQQEQREKWKRKEKMLGAKQVLKHADIRRCCTHAVDQGCGVGYLGTKWVPVQGM